MLVVVASFAMQASSFSADVESLYFNAYQVFGQAEKLDGEGKSREALEKLRDVERTLRDIVKTSPDWRPLMVEYRLKKTEELISRLETAVASLPPVADTIEGALPEPDRSAPIPTATSSGPEVSVGPPPGARTSRQSVRTQSTASQTTSLGSRGTDKQQIRELQAELAKERTRNETLTGKLTMALTELDRVKVIVVEQKALNAQANATLENITKDGESFGNLRAEVDKKIVGLMDKLAEAEAKNEVLEDENTRLLAKLDKASTYIVESDKIRDTLLQDRTKLADARDTALSKAKRIKDNTAEIERITGENKKLKTDLAFVTKSSKEEFSKLSDQNKELTAKLSEAEKNPASKPEMEKLAAEKKAVEEKLAKAEKDLAESLNKPNPEKDKLIATLQSELNSVNDKLLEAQAQIARAEEQTKGLQKQLDEATGQIAQFRLNPAPTKEEENLNTENELLRNIILRQIKEQTKRDEAKKGLEQEIATLQIKSDVINRQLEVLGAPVLQLTDEERSLFKEPVALLSEPSKDALEVTMAVTTQPLNTGVIRAEATPTPSADAIPDDVREMVVQAKKLFEVKNYAETEKVYQQIVERVPQNYFALSNLAAVQIESGKLSAAEVALKKAISINDKDSFAYTNLGILYSRQGKFDEAIDALKTAITLNEKDSVAHNYLGVCLGQKDQRVDAEKEFKRAIELDQDYPDAHFNLAVLYATTQPQSMELAKHYYNKATELGAAPDPSLERLIQ